MKQDFSTRNTTHSWTRQAYSSPRLLEYGSVVQLTQGKSKSHRLDNGICSTSTGAAEENRCLTEPRSNSSAPAKRRTK